MALHDVLVIKHEHEIASGSLPPVSRCVHDMAVFAAAQAIAQDVRLFKLFARCTEMREYVLSGDGRWIQKFQ